MCMCVYVYVCVCVCARVCVMEGPGQEKMGGWGISKLQGLYNKESWKKEGGEEEEKGEGSTSVGRALNCCKRGEEKEERV